MGNKTLKECEERLADIKGRLKAILKEQEEAIKEWNAAFISESPDKIECIYETTGQCYDFFLVKGDARLEVANIWSDELEGDIDVFYKGVSSAIGIRKMANKSRDSFPEQYENLIMAKAMEIRQRILAIRDGNVISLQDRVKDRD